MRAKTHQDLDPSGPPLTIYFVHVVPTRSNSELQTLATQFADVSSKRPDELMLDDSATFTPQIQAIQPKITPTVSLAQSMTQNGLFWAICS